MKAPSKNMAASIRKAAGSPGRDAPSIAVGKPMGRASMIVPGEGGIERPRGELDERSAAHYADVMRRQTGG